MLFRKKLVILQYNLTRYLALENIPFQRISARRALWQNKMVEEIPPASNFKTVSSELAFRSLPHTSPVLCLALLQFYVIARKHSTFQNFSWLLLNKHMKSFIFPQWPKSDQASLSYLRKMWELLCYSSVNEVVVRLSIVRKCFVHYLGPCS